MRQTAANRAPYIESSKVIDAYGNEMQNCIDHHQDHIAHIGVLGSLGTGWGRKDSDMDIQIILEDQLIDLDNLTNLSSWELATRKKLADTLQMPHLARHRASIMTHQERSLYMRGFMTSFLLPRVFGEYKHIYGTYTHGIELFPSSIKSIQADLYVTLQHKNKGHLHNKSPKWMRRNARDIHRYESGKRYKDDPDMDRLVAELFNNDFSIMQQTTEQYIHNFTTQHGNALLKKKRETDTLLRTREKTRREIVQSYKDNEYFHRWTQDKHQGFGFSPQNIYKLAQKYYKKLSPEGAEKTQALMAICHNIKQKPSKDNLTALFAMLNHRIPSMIEHINTPRHHNQLAYQS